jgi:hypothetical protein
VKQDDPDYLPFGPIARNRIGEQAQYASAYIHGRGRAPNLGEGLRFKGDPKDYHDVQIHKDDVDTFVERVLAHRRACGMIP